MHEVDRSAGAGDGTASRRDFLRHSRAIASATALAGTAIPAVHAAGSDAIRLALVGCGGRGSGAVANAMNSAYGPVSLHAMADVVETRLTGALGTLSRQYGERVDVPKERQFVGFDAYKHAIDCLRPGDVAMLTSFAYVRPLQLEYAVSRGVNVFMEKSFGPDAPSLVRMLRAGEAAREKNLKIAAGLQCRHSVNRQELIKRIRDGAIGDVVMVRAYRVHAAGRLRAPRPADVSELLWQIRNFTHFLWVSGGLYAEMDIHQVDELCWLADQWPETARAFGGRAADSDDRGQNFDSLSVEWTFPNGVKGFDGVRWLGGHCFKDFSTYVHGTKAAAQFSGATHRGITRIFKDQRCTPDTIAWEAADERIDPWDAEWNALLKAIREDREHNEVERAVKSNLATLMGRAALHSGREITWDEMIASKFRFFPGAIDDLDYGSAPPVLPDADGFYPVPVPGVWNET